ncbi:hypothetical protein DERP_014496 [Dermatophagoides pteronyssinus]|uniref:Uncharacterized protein n=1 Tax=Dermatophagoides pteronyssinus TaxID=6956 RepID=A0ABQ8JTL6_DERPT|nr:hypothetical protein DERP_014496 [Dermatophagoides pteronyssinus]
MNKLQVKRKLIAVDYVDLADDFHNNHLMDHVDHDDDVDNLNYYDMVAVLVDMHYYMQVVNRCNRGLLRNNIAICGLIPPLPLPPPIRLAKKGFCCCASTFIGSLPILAIPL